MYIIYHIKTLSIVFVKDMS